MKKMLILLLSCTSLTSFAAGWETVTGNGNLKKEQRNAAGYSGIQSQGVVNVQVTYGTASTITVEADENLLPYIETSVEEGNLVIKIKKGINVKSKNNLTVNATLTKLTLVALSGSGNIIGTGNFNNNGKTQFKVSGSGNIGMGVGTLNEVDIAISGSGNVKLKGDNCNNITAAISGSGNIDCGDIKTSDVFAKVSGSGDIKVYATSSIDAKVSGSGNIYYKGNAPKLNMKASGSGKIIKA